jgi:aminomethyltransferase
VSLTASTAGYAALRESAGWLDLSSRGVIRATGEDRARLLHAMTTAHIQELKPGEWRYVFFLSAQGRILADANILCREDDFLIETEPVTRTFLYGHLDKFIIADDVTLEDLSGAVSVVGLEGPKAKEVAVAAGLDTPWTISSTGTPGLRFIVPAQELPELAARLENAGAVRAAPADARVVRLENGRPRFGEDITERFIPHEVRLAGAVHFGKGCYLGQEIVERVRSRGQVNRLLTHLHMPPGGVPAPETQLENGGERVGFITSADFSPGENCVFALGYVRTDHARPGTQLTCNGATATVTDRYKELQAP